MDINKKYSIAFSYIKKIDEQIHIFYYLIDNKNPTKCKLINYFLMALSGMKILFQKLVILFYLILLLCGIIIFLFIFL